MQNIERRFAGIKYHLVRCAPAVECALRLPQGQQRCLMWFCRAQDQAEGSPHVEVVCKYRFLETCVHQRSPSISEVHVPEMSSKHRSLENVCEHLGKINGTTKHDLRDAIGQPAGDKADYV